MLHFAFPKIPKFQTYHFDTEPRRNREDTRRCLDERTNLRSDRRGSTELQEERLLVLAYTALIFKLALMNLPVLQVGPVQPGRHKHSSGDTHRPPLWQWRLHTTGFNNNNNKKTAYRNVAVRFTVTNDYTIDNQ